MDTSSVIGLGKNYLEMLRRKLICESRVQKRSLKKDINSEVVNT